MLVAIWSGQDDGILVIPTVADPPPKLGGKEVLSSDYLRRAFSLLSLASVSGCCQVNTLSIPLFFLSPALSIYSVTQKPVIYQY